MNYPIRRIAVIVLEATTPFRTGVGEANELSDSPVLTDANGLPMIAGSSIRGVLRHALGAGAKSIMGHAENGGEGSKIRLSHAHVTNETGAPAIGLLSALDSYQQKLTGARLPRREHVRIGSNGVAEDKGKFDELIVPRGVRLVFEAELLDGGALEAEWKAFLEQMASPDFRLGSGSRRGFGRFRIVSFKTRSFDLRKPEDRKAYADRPYLKIENGASFEEKADSKRTEQNVLLTPENFWLASQGYGDRELDTVPAKETIVRWQGGRAETKESWFLPASGFKGALSHRIAYHYNRIKKEKKTGKDNCAVNELFGCEKEGSRKARAGKLLFEDVHIAVENGRELIQTHVSLDRFTQKAMDGALYDEKALDLQKPIELKISYPEEAMTGDVKRAYDCALFDLKNGLLPLGSLTGRGYGAMKEKK